jgi:hypothetical protein
MDRGIRRQMIPMRFILFFLFLPFVNAGELTATFVGDVMLGREVEREMLLRQETNPWSKLLFNKDGYVIGNFEGAVGLESECLQKGTLCLNVDPKRIPLLKRAGFTHMGVENNHSHDLGEKHYSATQTELEKNDIGAMSFELSPYFITKNGVSLGIVTVNWVTHRPKFREIQMKLRLAKQASDWAIVYIHWGTELLPMINEQQKDLAQKLMEAGADLILGHHPHVIQPARCINYRPVYYSLGNHLFDQRYPSTQMGLAVSCTFGRNNFHCSRKHTKRPSGSSYPEWSDAKLSPLECESVKKPKSSKNEPHWGVVTVGRQRALIYFEKGFELSRTSGFDLQYFAPFKHTDATQSYFIGHRAYSTFDNTVALRPSMYSIQNNELIADWKGSVLAYPTEDFEILQDSKSSFLCAFHSERSYFLKKPTPIENRLLTYSWNGFGFSREKSESRQKQCRTWALAAGYL